jgi:subtilisin family serine protease
MIKFSFSFLTIALFVVLKSYSFSQGFGFDKVLREMPNAPTTFCIDNNYKNIQVLEKYNVDIKFTTKNWLFVTCSPSWIQSKVIEGSIKSFYFEHAPPQLLNDTTRSTFFVNPVQQGLGGLSQGYTGKNVLIGVIDSGVDFNHPDFIDSNGKTRILRYWDHSMSGPNSPQPYNYGQEWDSTDINNGTITSMDDEAHGTTVAGAAAGNGLANGQNKGMAPDANIVVVETNFSMPNWTLSIADACDYIFKVAEEYNMPAVINLSVGTYLGSHDGNDPASEMMEQLMDDKPGRLIVSAAGNSGTWGKYHCHGNVTTDTTFVWFKNNPSGQLGNNTIYFDFWTDTITANSINFAFGADKPAPAYGFRGRTNFHSLNGAMASSPIVDTLYNSNGNRLAIIKSYREVEGPNFHMQVLFSTVDSTSYNYRFMTKGNGEYDLWSGTVLGLNEIVATLPLSSLMPSIIHYQMPDSMQSVVSSWNCSEKIISVGNVRNRSTHIDKNGNPYVPFPSSVGEISPNSARGPSRLGIVKPDISVGGDITLSAAPMWLLNNPAYNSAIDSNGWHARNGGTSMASPVIAGIAALYLEKCRYGTYSSFKQLLTSTAFTDGFTGSVPNTQYGYGKVHALNLMLQAVVEPIPNITQNMNQLIASSSINYQWVKNGSDLTNETNQTLATTPPDGDFQVYAVSSDGCPSISAPYFAALSLDELNHSKVLLFPNPSNDVFKIVTDEKIIVVNAYNEVGQEMMLTKLGKDEYGISSWSDGIYLLDIQTEKGLIQLKLIVK